MDIQVNENYRLKSDAMNIIIQRKHLSDPTKAPNWEKRKSEGASAEVREVWRDYKYCTRVEDALQVIFEQQVRDSQAETFAELLAEIKGFRREMKALLAFK